MRPRAIHEFSRKMNELFRIRNGHIYNDPMLMILTGRIELDILKLDDLLHERHGDYEYAGKSMTDVIVQEYGAAANAFIEYMINGRDEPADSE